MFSTPYELDSNKSITETHVFWGHRLTILLLGNGKGGLKIEHEWKSLYSLIELLESLRDYLLESMRSYLLLPSCQADVLEVTGLLGCR
jgi:hypothetical protein